MVCNGDRSMTWESSDSKGIAKHWKAFVVFVAAAAAIFTWGVYVFVWFAGNAKTSGLVPGTLGFWSMSNLLTFIVYGVLWELLLVVPPVAVAAGVGWRWWRRLPEEERRGRRFGSNSGSAGGGLSLLFFIAFCIKVFLDGKWNIPIASFTLDYMVGSLVVILEWGLVIIGVPAALALVWWISRGRKAPLRQ
jgi:hypothetical protein